MSFLDEARKKAEEEAERRTKMSEPKKCPKCGGEMDRGILARAKFGGDWFRFVPSESVWYVGSGEKAVAFRCRQCGFVEVYSTEPPKSDR